jgi:hypothetical protein
VPVEPDLGRIREVGADLDEARPEVGVADVEVVDADAALLAEELKAHRLRLGGAVAGADDPLELLAGDDRHDPEAPLALCGLQIGPHVVELAVIPTRAIRLFQVQDRDPLVVGEALDVAAEAVADRPQQRGRRDRLAQMARDEPHDLPTDLQARHVRIEIQPIDALDLQRHMTIENVVDVRHARHQRRIHHEAGPCPADAEPATRGRPGGGPVPLPLRVLLARVP